MNARIPAYSKGVGALVSFGLVAVLGCLYMQGYMEDASSPSRQLLESKTCKGDVILPLAPSEDDWDVAVRAIFYLIFLGYLFLVRCTHAEGFTM